MVFSPPPSCYLKYVLATLTFCFLNIFPSLTLYADTITQTVPIQHPLSPPDLSSPRATLEGFLSNVTFTINGWKSKTNSPEVYQAHRRCLEALDFSTTPNDACPAVQLEHIVMLKEILDRIELPPFADIPDAIKVAEQHITRWTIPNTDITISRCNEGTKEGKFIFSANTVQNIARDFFRVKDLPYVTTNTAGIYDQIKAGKHTAYSFEKRARFRLKPIDTESPRAALEGFLNSTNEAYAIIQRVKKSHRQMTKTQIRQAEADATDLFERAISTLDLRNIPPENRTDRAIESVLLLKEIIDRMPLPAPDFIPDATAVAIIQKHQRETIGHVQPFIWRYPNTEIEIVRIEKGKNSGQFLFSADTVQRLNEFYSQIKDYPYRPNTVFTTCSQDTLPSTKTEGFYTYYTATPGVLVPHAKMISKVANNLPRPFKKVYKGQTVWQWIALTLSTLFIALSIILSYKIIWTPSKERKKPLRNWLRLLVPILIITTTYYTIVFLNEDVNLTGSIQTIIYSVGKLLMILLSAWVVFAFCQAIAETIIHSHNFKEKDINTTILKLTFGVTGAILGCAIIIKGSQRLGIDMLPILAGFGIGGLAVALAAKQTFANIIGSLILLFNKPVKVGDFCRYGNQLGTVEHIGLISTRIRSLERTVVTVPNADFSEMHLDNFQLRDQRLLKVILQLRYETTPEQLRWILVKLRELLLNHPMVSPDPARVRFVGYGASSKDIEVFAYLYCQKQNTFLAIQEDVLLRIEDIILESGSGFAFPSQTIYTSKDDGVDAEKGNKVESEVQTWRKNNQLPFPDFSEERRIKLKDTLMYPPEGSETEKS